MVAEEVKPHLISVITHGVFFAALLSRLLKAKQLCSCQDRRLCGKDLSTCTLLPSSSQRPTWSQDPLSISRRFVPCANCSVCDCWSVIVNYMLRPVFLLAFRTYPIPFTLVAEYHHTQFGTMLVN